jgi:hypothetical protein
VRGILAPEFKEILYSDNDGYAMQFSAIVAVETFPTIFVNPRGFIHKQVVLPKELSGQDIADSVTTLIWDADGYCLIKIHIRDGQKTVFNQKYEVEEFRDELKNKII